MTKETQPTQEMPTESVRPPRQPRRAARLVATASALALTLAACATDGVESAEREVQVSAPTSTTTTPMTVNNRVPPAVSTSGQPRPSPETRFLYAGGMQFVEAAGASVEFTQDHPYTEFGDHSLVELAAQSRDGKHIVEVGWVADENINGNTLPHLFVFHWENSVPSCYNACGFVQVSDTIQPGDPVNVGETGTYGIEHVKSQWQISYNSELIGYYPDSLWLEEGGFTSIGLIQAFGEVATNSTITCSDMGNGTYGGEKTATQISNYTLEGTMTPESLTPLQTDPALYSYQTMGATSISIGGPGAC